MPSENYKDPFDFELPESYRRIDGDEFQKASQSPELRRKVRFFAQQVKDVQSCFIKEGESLAERAFLKECRKDSKAFRKAIQARIEAARMKNDLGVVGFIFDSLRCSNKPAQEGQGNYHFSVEIRPLLFTSLLDDQEKEAERYPFSDNKYTVFLHFDQHHAFQMTRFAEPEVNSPMYRHVMERLLSVFSSKDMKALLEGHYGEWEYLADAIVERMVEGVRNLS